MSITAFSQWSATATSNVDLNSIPLSDSMLADQIDGAFQEMMAQLKTGVAPLSSPTFTTPTLGVASATSISFGNETLSAYREGTWNPTINFAGGATGITYGTQLGRYTRVGRLVTIEAQVTLTSKGSATGAATIVGLPFAINGTLGGALTIAPVGGVFASLTAGLAATFELGTTSMTVRVPTTTGTSAATDANFTNTSSFRLGGSYSV